MRNLVWSYSMLSTYDRCALQAQARYVTREYPYKESPEMRFGNEVHKQIEHYVKKVDTELMDREEDFSVLVDKAIALPGPKAAEHEVGLTIDWRPTGFKARDVWGRCKIDFYALTDSDTAMIVDWKTGKPWEDPLELEIQAMFLKIYYPKLKSIWGMYAWLKNGEFGTPYNLGASVEKTKAFVSETMKKIEMDRWPPTKNKLCGWCEYQHCPFYKETRRKDA